MKDILKRLAKIMPFVIAADFLIIVLAGSTNSKNILSLAVLALVICMLLLVVSYIYCFIAAIREVMTPETKRQVLIRLILDWLVLCTLFVVMNLTRVAFPLALSSGVIIGSVGLILYHGGRYAYRRGN